VEYELQTQPVGPPVFLFVVDTCVDEDELAHLRDALQQTLNLLPEDALVGLITFGTHVHVHELGFTDCPKSYVFRGEKDYPPQKVQDMLGVTPIRAGPAGSAQGIAGGTVTCPPFLFSSRCCNSLDRIDSAQAPPSSPLSADSCCQ
jgi:protein transport protein SEC23